MKTIRNIILSMAVLALAACGTQRQATGDDSKSKTSVGSDMELRRHELAFVQKVSDNTVYAKTYRRRFLSTLRKEQRISV